MGGVVAGLIALLVFLGAAEMVALAIGPNSAPTIALGQNVIGHTPQNLKEFAITHFGENDKNVLLGSVYAVLVVAAAAVGGLAARTRRIVALVALTVLGAVSTISAVTQPAASAWYALPSALGAVAAVAAYFLLVDDEPRLVVVGTPTDDRVAAANGGAAATAPPAMSRRNLLTNAGWLFALGGAAYVAGKHAMTSIYNAASSRAAVKLPIPSSTSQTVTGTNLAVSGLAPYITSNDEFYRVDTALVVPQLSTEGYTLNLHGMVDHPSTWTFQDLLEMDLVERTMTMVCVSNPVGGPYLGNARWLGVLLADLLAKSGVHRDADQLFMTSSDGMTIGADLRTAMDGRPAMLAVGMNGQPLPFEHGFPVRAVIPGVYGYASACKWLVAIEVTTYAAKKAYWVQRGYAERAPVKLESKIDTPGSFAQLKKGLVTVAGSAWHPTVGIRGVEVQVDDGPWREADLGAVESLDTWRLWKWDWHANSGTHSLQVRAIDAKGQVQTAKESQVVPNGTSGQQSVVVTVS